VTVAFRTIGESEKPPLLLLHGFMGCGADWDSVGRALSDQFTCITPDLPGHGLSPFDPVAHSTFTGYAASVIKLLDALDLESVSAAGYSMGGRILLALALEYPERFSRIVIESASPGIADEDERALRREADTELAARLQREWPEPFLSSWYDLTLFGALKTCPGFPNLMRRRLNNAPEALAQALAVIGTGQQEPLWDRLSTLKSETLVIYGEQDEKYKKVTQRMRAYSGQLSCKAIADCSHATHAENPERFAEICRSFLVGQSKGCEA
jgi:2-succinyl-6-hydroxy-2,4-cyclohexadiene-1-carboxylate synthase